MRSPIAAAACLFAVLLPCVRAAAQDDVLAVERREDVRAHERLATRLRATRMDFRAEGLTPREVCRLFAAATRDTVSFSCTPAAAAAGGTVDLDLKQASLWSAMAVVQAQTELRFLYRAGVVFLAPKADVKPMTFLQVYDLRPQVARLRSFPGPRLGLVGPGEEGVLFPPEEESEQTVSGFTAEGIETLLRDGVLPGHWDDEGVSLANNGGLFLIRHTPQGHREIRLLLDRLGLLPLPRVVRVRPR